MANFSPVVNTVGAIYTHADGIVLRSSYHVFDLFTNHTFDEILHSALASPSFDVPSDQSTSNSVPHLDAVATRDTATGQVGITLVNLHGEDAISCRVRGLDAVTISEIELIPVDLSNFAVDCPPHSVTVLNLN